MSRLELLQEMLQENSNDPFLHYAIALEWEKNNQLDDAIQQLVKMTINFPDYLPTFYKLGKLFELKEKTTNALQYYKTGIELAKKQNDVKTLNELKEAVFLLED